MAKARKLKVCLVSGTFPPLRCGIGDYTYRLAESLSLTSQLELSVLTSSTAQSAVEFPAEIYPDIVNWNWADFWPLLKRLRKLAPDVVHYQYPTAVYRRKLLITFLPWLLTLGFLLGFRRPPSTVITIHEYSSFRVLGKLRIWLMVLPASKIICLSPTTVQALRLLKFLGKKILCVPLGSNLVAAPPISYTQNSLAWRQEHSVAQDKPVVAYFGFVSPSKGLDTLIEAFNQLKQPAQLLLIAEPKAQDASYSSYLQNIEELIKKSSQAIQWTGFAPEEEVAAYLQSATLAVLPFTDGVSIRRTSLMAALVNGVATISTESTEAPDLLETGTFKHGENIWLVPPNNPTTLLAGLENLLADAALREKIAQNGKKFSAQFSWESIAQRHLQIYTLHNLART